MLQAASPLPGAGESRLHLSGSSASIDQHQPPSRGLVLLGYSPKPYGSREPFGELLLSLADNAHPRPSAGIGSPRPAASFHRRTQGDLFASFQLK
ncbi:MAG: hypothetical protein EOQ40_23390 [Mesorhizobium sp.]|uniref:hypothetical protein n=1 Tax=Mesorhizobium sp. TaxID=1871066 RepID=UPI000FE93858|nr:hypothetical protein [Mesorhizobium sp.]RWB18763.1 MAG: hypothetical protein EOQ40_23390 [Mesorhizobium sp.]